MVCSMFTCCIAYRNVLAKISSWDSSTITASRLVQQITVPNMPVARPNKLRKPPPDGFDDIEDTLLEYANKMKDAISASHEGKKKYETLWPVFQVTHQSR